MDKYREDVLLHCKRGHAFQVSEEYIEGLDKEIVGIILQCPWPMQDNTACAEAIVVKRRALTKAAEGVILGEDSPKNEIKARSEQPPLEGGNGECNSRNLD